MNRGRASLPHLEPPAIPLHDDPRWELVQRIVASSRFAKAPLLSKFLVHVCAASLEGRQQEISEYQIGVQVFDRPHDYRTVEDNIVRNYARQLRRRLAEYFATEGRDESMQVQIPVGGYVPVFLPEKDTPPESIRHPAPGIPTLVTPVPQSLQAPLLPAKAPVASNGSRRRHGLALGFLLAYTALLVWLAFSLANRWHREPVAASPAHDFWTAFLRAPLNTFVVPADCGFNVLEELSHRQISLADYLKGDLSAVPLPAIDGHSATDLRSQQFTSFVDTQVVSSLARLPEMEPRRMVLRFPRDLRFEDLKTGNVILIGSIGSNPWSEVAQKNLNFRIAYGNQMQQAWVTNAKPLAGEAAIYASHWNEPAHQTYAILAVVPNLGGNGHMLLIEGLDVAGTQAAAETLFRGDAIAAILRQAVQPDGSLRPFEVLLQSTSIESNAANAQVIASRIH